MKRWYKLILVILGIILVIYGTIWFLGGFITRELGDTAEFLENPLVRSFVLEELPIGFLVTGFSGLIVYLGTDKFRKFRDEQK